MKDAEKWLLRELQALRFAPYEPLLPQVKELTGKLYAIELKFMRKAGTSLTKRQAVGFGLLARTFQLVASALANLLLQNFAGWTCSYRSLLETFFVLNWIAQDAQRFEAYFEGAAPVIGRIKTEVCGRHPVLVPKYADASGTTHIGDRALHLPRLIDVDPRFDLPFAATLMQIAGPELERMMMDLIHILNLLVTDLQSVLIDNFEATRTGEVLWSPKSVSAKFGCLGFEPKSQAT